MNAKRHTLITIALDLFYNHGIHSIGINEVLKVSGIAKKTLYNHFASKEDLVLAALDERHQRFLTWLNGHLEKGKSDVEVVEQLFLALNDWFLDNAKELGCFRGCFFINTAAEFANPNHPIAQSCQTHKQQVRELIKRHLIHPEESFLDAVCLLKEGAISCAYVSNDLEAAQKAWQVAKTLIGQKH